MRKVTFGWNPNPDLVLLSDYNKVTGQQPTVTFQVEMKTPIGTACQQAVETCLLRGDMTGAYNALWKYEADQMSRKGRGQAMLQAAFGLLQADSTIIPKHAGGGRKRLARQK